MENHGFPKKNQKTFFKFFFLEHVSHYIMSSICGKNFSLIGLTVSEISKWSKKRRGGTLNLLSKFSPCGLGKMGYKNRV